MESTVDFIDSSEVRSEGVGEKRPAPAVEVEEEDVIVLKEGSPPPKRVKGVSDNRSFVVGDVKEVAEMVLVLAAMAKMRGGKGPTDVEREVMAEARNRLVKVCEGFAPKDIFPRDAFGGVIEDLGLNRLKEQKLGYRPPRMSIAEKMLVSKRKMEKAEDYSLLSTPHSSRLQGNSGAAVDSRSASHPIRTSQPDKSSHMSISSGNFQSGSPLGHVAANSTSLPYQLPTSEIRPIVSSAIPSSHLSSAALQRVDKSHLRSDGRSNGSLHPSQVQANYSGNSNVRTPTWSVQPQPALSSKSGSDNKVPVNMSFKVEGAAGVRSGLTPHTTSRAVVTQTTGPPPQVTNNVQAPPVGNTHSEIGKIVQKFLHPRVSERPTWNPPSREYMSKALTCQMCMSTVTDIDSILICDACEKGYHLKCLQTTNQKGVPRGEWHCGKCLSLSNGKPLPPKYGRVMRNMNTPKVSSNSTAVPSSSSKKVGASDEKVSQPKVIVNGHTTIETAPTELPENKCSHQTTGLEREAKGMQGNDGVSRGVKMEEKISSGIYPNNLMKTSSSVSGSSVNASVEKPNVEKVVEIEPNSSAQLVMVPSLSERSEPMVNAAETSPLEQSMENHLIVRDSKESHVDKSSNNGNQLKEQEAIHVNPSEIAGSAGAMNQGMSLSDGLHAVNWVGDPIQVLDDKIYYATCHINGHVYKAMDHVLIRFNHGKLIPSTLQAMWEDKSTTMKWVTVNRCYFPGDLPEAVGRPCGLESSEVYESTCGITMKAGSIESPCEVLPPRRFAEESERRTRSGTQLNDQFPPLYLCKWIYDEAKGLFRDISC
ncbi:hypothetical protein BUALT_Bualt03G0111400 [Buddleja alternifolia]|uniref:PHD finger protein n=1 Tax=Buddleja alternifolia TaxID=168488 RepID=A0AAV6Y0Y2_9LAMI|nr:hypothetical protein BUALT_Bualt03G0111400 [Buddleja alternifolia]